MNKSKYLRILAWAIILYMLSALAWWSILLYNKNEQLYEDRLSLLSYKESQIEPVSVPELTSLDSYRSLLIEYRSQKRMISAEGVVFGIILMIGLWLINRAYQHEIAYAESQKNFLLSITHELKSPIASVKLILETFLKRSLKDEQIKDFSANALTEIDRLNHLVSNLLTSSKIESNYIYNYEEANFVEFLWRIVARYESKHPEFLFQKESSHPAINLSFDKEALELVFSNVLENAIKYSPNEKKIGVEVCLGKGKVFIAIKDCGLGIPQNEKEKVFDKFYRIGSEEVRKSKGTGLGLFITRQFVLAHHGQISLKDNEPVGTIIQIEIPIKNKIHAHFNC